MSSNAEQDAIDARADKLRDLLVRFLIDTSLKDPRFEQIITALAKVVKSADAPRDDLDRKAKREISESRTALDQVLSLLASDSRDAVVPRVVAKLEPKLLGSFEELKQALERVKAAANRPLPMPEIDLSGLVAEFQRVQEGLSALEGTVLALHGDVQHLHESVQTLSGSMVRDPSATQMHRRALEAAEMQDGKRPPVGRTVAGAKPASARKRLKSHDVTGIRWELVSILMVVPSLVALTLGWGTRELYEHFRPQAADMKVTAAQASSGSTADGPGASTRATQPVTTPSPAPNVLPESAPAKQADHGPQSGSAWNPVWDKAVQQTIDACMEKGIHPGKTFSQCACPPASSGEQHCPFNPNWQERTTVTALQVFLKSMKVPALMAPTAKIDGKAGPTTANALAELGKTCSLSNGLAPAINALRTPNGAGTNLGPGDAALLALQTIRDTEPVCLHNGAHP